MNVANASPPCLSGVRWREPADRNVSGASAAAALALKTLWTPPLLPLLLTTGMIMATSYVLMVWRLDLLQADEKLTLIRFVRKLRRR